ncbi:hypothetical protein QP157_18190 [Sphingomonas sp. LR61]
MDDLRDLTGPLAGARIEVRRLDPVPDLGALAAAADGDLVWLDSALPDGAPEAARPRARWSVLTWTDGPFVARFRHQDRQASVEVAAPAADWFGPSSSDDRPAFAVLADLLARTPQLPEPIVGCGFALGWVGFLGYELGRESGGPDRTADGYADADLRFVDRAVVVDHTGGAWALTLVADAEPAASAQNRAWLETVTGAPSPADVADAATGLPAGVSSAVGRTSRADHERAVDACRAEIREGNAFQVCLTTSFSVPGGDRRPGSAPARTRTCPTRTCPTRTCTTTCGCGRRTPSRSARTCGSARCAWRAGRRSGSCGSPRTAPCWRNRSRARGDGSLTLLPTRPCGTNSR